MINQDEDLKRKYEHITSIAGVGKITGVTLLHLFINYPNANSKQITSLVGLDPIRKQSGTSIQSKTRISKAGSRIYRGDLFMSAMVAIRYNEKMKVFYERLKDNSKQTTQAQAAVMRKLTILAHSLYKNEQMYDKDRYKRESGLEKCA